MPTVFFNFIPYKFFEIKAINVCYTNFQQYQQDCETLIPKSFLVFLFTIFAEMKAIRCILIFISQ